MENIVFDFGGVIINLDVSRTINEFERLGIANVLNSTGHNYTNSIFYDFEIGKVSEIEFIKKLKSLSTLNPSCKDIRQAWNAMILDIPKGNIDFLLRLGKTHRIFLLSNSNSIHQEKFITEVNKKNNISFNHLFERAYYSHEIGLRKPNKKIFNFLIQKNKLNTDETLFVDDSIDNIKIAEEVGIKGYHYSGGSLEKILEKNGIKI